MTRKCGTVHPPILPLSTPQLLLPTTLPQNVSLSPLKEKRKIPSFQTSYSPFKSETTNSPLYGPYLLSQKNLTRLATAEITLSLKKLRKKNRAVHRERGRKRWGDGGGRRTRDESALDQQVSPFILLEGGGVHFFSMIRVVSD